MVGHVMHCIAKPNSQHNAELQLFYPHFPHNTIKQLAAQAWHKYVVVAHPNGTNMVWWPSNPCQWQCMGDGGVHVSPSDGMGEGRAMLGPRCVGGVVTEWVYTSHDRMTQTTST
jgi:hypothetical protein